MPKKGQPRQGGSGSSKKAPLKPATTDASDDSFIVFGNAKPKKTPDPKNRLTVQSNGGPDAGPALAGEPPQRPNTRALIGGASWTGKLPVNLLSELCQKQRWEKPEYTMAKTLEGFSSMVILKASNPKTREITSLPPFKLPPSHKHLAFQPTAVEARHFAAAYALFRVSSMKNIHMTLPPAYRDLWKGQFQELKKEDVKEGKGWMYEADPFQAKREREEAQAAAAKMREEREKQKAREETQNTMPGINGNKISRGWAKVPKVEMGKRMRAEIEQLVRNHAIWNPHNIELVESQGISIVNELVQLGFRRSHIEEAIVDCKDKEEVLEWLLIHVPEDDLPKWSLPEGYTAGISMASGNLKREASIKRLAEAGYAPELCGKILDKNSGNEGKAAEVLQRILFSHESEEDFSDKLNTLAVSERSMQDLWDEEQVTLEAIFGERYHKFSVDIVEIILKPPKLKGLYTLRVRRPESAYPTIPPIVSVHHDGLPAYIRLSIIRQTLQHAKDSLIGEQMIFNLIDWLENNLSDIIERPGKLKDVSSVGSSIGEVHAGSGSGRPERRPNNPKPINWNPASERSLEILNAWETKRRSTDQQNMLKARQSLPAWRLKEKIIQTVNSHQVTIISGETGSGKSTQSVQFILDDMIERKLGAAANIICTQPRRISALGLADRVSEERSSVVGDEVGYVIRGESKTRPGNTKITFVTTGVLLRRLQTSSGHFDREESHRIRDRASGLVAALANVSHVVVDEVHERSLDTDFLLILLREVLRKRSDLKVILMSATLDADIFESYFGGSRVVGRLEIQGRTFPVEDYYLDDIISMTGYKTGKSAAIEEDEEERQDSVAKTIQSIGMKINYELVAQTVRQIDLELGDKEGGILIFLPGVVEINKSLEAVRSLPGIHALPLHASLLPAEQRRVFPLPPKGRRKVIAATNVAETSITIPDIVAVIDTGRVKETSFDPHNSMVRLEEVWASRAACKQRRGRAGRVSAGTCYKLYTKNAETTKMPERPLPEIQRVPLEQLCLSVKAMDIPDVQSFLASAITPPEIPAVEGALDLLAQMGVIEDDNLTALGKHLAMIPADIRCGKLLVYGAIFGCFDACLTLASILTVKSPFVSPANNRDAAKASRASFTSSNNGDLLADLNAFSQWSASRSSGQPWSATRAWCDANFLSQQTLQEISTNRVQYASTLSEIGFVPVGYIRNPQEPVSLNIHNENEALIRALIAAAFTPQIARIEFPDAKFAASVTGAVALDPEARTIKYFTKDTGRVFVHPGSTLFDAKGFRDGVLGVSWWSKVATSKVFIRELTPLSPYALLLFSASPPTVDTLGRGLVIDDWFRLRGWARIGVLVSRLRGLLDDVLARKIEEPGLRLDDMATKEGKVVSICRRLLLWDGMDR